MSTQSIKGYFSNAKRRIYSYLFSEIDPTPLAVFRILFGFLMFLDVPQERGLDDADLRFGDENYCFFPLFEFIKPVSLPYACVIYSVMWIGSIGICIGLCFRLSCLLYLIPYLYFFFLDKSRWNNHSYLFALITCLLFVSEAGSIMSIDSVKDRLERRAKRELPQTPSMPRWNLFLFKFQFFLLFFLAGVKKLETDWLNGFSMKNLSGHYIFTPLRTILPPEVIDFYMIHLGGLAFDLSVGFLLNFKSTKKLAFIASFAFHGMNAFLFHIGMFTFVCLSSLVLFCDLNEFPLRLFISPKGGQPLNQRPGKGSKNKEEIWPKKLMHPAVKNETKRDWRLILGIATYICIQLGLPFSHGITKGYNNWTDGLYGYSWDMMVWSWDTLHVKVTVKDRTDGIEKERYLDPDVWTSNDRWTSHSDMAKQYSYCVKRNLARYNISDIGVYLDIWKSLNGRFQQRVFDPRVEMLSAPWSPFSPTPWILPLLKEFSYWRRSHFEEITREVSNWTSSSNVIFVADFPQLYLDNFLPVDLQNVSLTLMAGGIVLESPQGNTTLDLNGVLNASVPTGVFHKVHTISPGPSCYMYTYRNATADAEAEKNKGKPPKTPHFCQQFMDAMSEFFWEKWESFSRSFLLVANSYLHLLFKIPLVYRKSN